MTETETIPGRRETTPAERKRATALITKILAARRDADPETCAALGKALAETAPSSDHGRLLAAAIGELRDEPGRRPRDPAAAAVWWLARHGTTPTAAAVPPQIETAAGWERKQETTKAAVKAACDDPAGARAAAWVAEVVHRTGIGPTWGELSKAMGWPRRLQSGVIRKLTKAGWLTSSSQARSLRPGRQEVSQ